MFLPNRFAASLAGCALVCFLGCGGGGGGTTPTTQPTQPPADTIAPVARVETPSQIAANMNPGWNLGNTLEGDPTEGSWGNPPVTLSTFQDVVDIGYKSVRIPVRFSTHLGADNVVNPAWLQRVSDVVDMARSLGLYAIVDMHHDYGTFGAGFRDNPDGAIAKFTKVWKQIAVKLRDKDPRVLFEVINEPGGAVEGDVNDLTPAQNNQLNAAVVAAIRGTGGINASRCVVCPLKWTSTTYAQDMALPADDNLIVTFHYYTPWSFTNGTDQTWGVGAGQAWEITDLNTSFGTMKTLFVDKGIPVILGEFGLNMGDNPPYYQWLWVDSLMQKAHDCGITTMVWDNGGLLDRAAHAWREPVRVAIQVQAARGNKNSLVNTGLAYTLPVSSSDLALPLVLNGNTLSRIKNGDTALVAIRDYAVSGATLTINGSYLSGLPSGTTTLSIGFSAGADQRIKLSKS